MVGEKGGGTFLEQWIGNEARWQRVVFRVLQDPPPYLRVFLPERKVLTGWGLIGVYRPPLDDGLFLCWVKVDNGG